MDVLKPTARSVLVDPRSDLNDDDLDELERRFFNQLVLTNGTLKTTYKNRLGDVDVVCSRLLHDMGRRARLLDIGVSSGVTTHEWVQSLVHDNIEFDLEAFDICVDASLVSFGNHFHALLDSSGRPLQFEFFGHAESNVFGESTARRLRRFFPVMFLRTYYIVATKLLNGRKRSQTVRLVSRHLQDNPDVSVFEFDLADLHLLQGRYELIRAANILNLAYFDSEYLRTAISSIWSKLVNDGLFCVVRTNSQGENHGSIYRKGRDTFDRVVDIGTGSEIDHLVMEFSGKQPN